MKTVAAGTRILGTEYRMRQILAMTDLGEQGEVARGWCGCDRSESQVHAGYEIGGHSVPYRRRISLSQPVIQAKTHC
jgi:hypothetical protein